MRQVQKLATIFNELQKGNDEHIYKYILSIKNPQTNNQKSFKLIKFPDLATTWLPNSNVCQNLYFNYYFTAIFEIFSNIETGANS